MADDVLHEKKPADMESSLLGKAMLLYGPQLTGVVIFLILWQYAINPMLERSAIDFSRNQQIVDQQAKLVTTQLETARVLEQTSIRLQAIVDSIRKQ